LKALSPFLSSTQVLKRGDAYDEDELVENEKVTKERTDECPVNI